MADLGHSASWASRVGEDPFGQMIVEYLGAAGVAVDLVDRSAGAPTGVYFKQPTSAGTEVFYYRKNSAASLMATEMIAPWPEIVPRVLHLSGITPALSKTCNGLVRHLILDRPFRESLISFDVNYRSGLWPPARAANDLLELSQASDIVFVGLDEAALLWETTTAESVRSLISAPQHLVVKDGANEAISFNGQEIHRSVAPVVDVVEHVGAGDAFAAGWLSALLEGYEDTGRLRLGHLVASHVLRSPTDSATMPVPEEILAKVSQEPREWR